ncbi:hypothetical protein PITCH_A890032 [uncultured Desulfobacterium sp.]|uniref:Uncharacterized protein n=1 Tax=uncultured Desulfobacterium sp. TaxID=201089 RepID=A0A445N3R3_9BACT|nr:hypothetical protein PITCH_A890032 [uncultured Desulfobacterium sp.]
MNAYAFKSPDKRVKRVKIVKVVHALQP